LKPEFTSFIFIHIEEYISTFSSGILDSKVNVLVSISASVSLQFRLPEERDVLSDLSGFLIV